MLKFIAKNKIVCYTFWVKLRLDIFKCLFSLLCVLSSAGKHLAGVATSSYPCKITSDLQLYSSSNELRSHNCTTITTFIINHILLCVLSSAGKHLADVATSSYLCKITSDLQLYSSSNELRSHNCTTITTFIIKHILLCVLSSAG